LREHLDNWDWAEQQRSIADAARLLLERKFVEPHGGVFAEAASGKAHIESDATVI
jgi:hypothetical protein